MKKVLITGTGSYIGVAVENWLNKFLGAYSVDTLDMRDTDWKIKNFEGYDVIFHVAGIAHVDDERTTKDKSVLYYKVNRDLTIETAKKAKASGVKQFIFMSSIIVYGGSGGINAKKVITKDTLPNPSNCYGDSKLQAEIEISRLASEEFYVAILRPPMIYGYGSKGNYPRLSKLVKVLPIFPSIINERSVLYIDNLCEFIRLIIENTERGIFYPQNSEYVSTLELAKLIAKAQNKKIFNVSFFDPVIRLLGCTNGKVGKMIKKAFGNLVYELEMSQYKQEYRVVDLKKSIVNTERSNHENVVDN